MLTCEPNSDANEFAIAFMPEQAAYGDYLAGMIQV